MLKHKAYKFRIYPNTSQKEILAKTFGSSRFVYNHFLNVSNTHYEQTKKSLSYYDHSSQLTQLKKHDDFKWLKEADSIALQSSLKDLSDSFSRFFKGQNARPHFKKKGLSKNGYTTKAVGNNIAVENGKIKLPKLGLIKIRQSRALGGRIISVTVSQTPSDKYFVSILCEVAIQTLSTDNRSVGIDLGLQTFATLSTGGKIDNERFTLKMAQKLAREQRTLSRRRLQAKRDGKNLRDAKNYQKQKILVARLYEKIFNQRQDFLHKVSTEIIKNHDIICMESLKVKNMMSNRKLSKSIADVSWSEFVSMIKYKSDWYGKEFIQIESWFPSSQICSNCQDNDGRKSLDVRDWTCSNCGAHHDRDINASINILNRGLTLRSI